MVALVSVGIDDSDGFLAAVEIDETVYVCDGANGQDEREGGSTAGMMLSDSIRLSKSDGCPAGGRLMVFGLDNGDNGGTAGNGVLDSGEIDDQTPYCSDQRISFVDDARPGATGSKPVAYQGMRISIEDTLYFAADDGVHGYELWGYNSTTDEMWMVADIRQGPWAVSPVFARREHGTQFSWRYTDDNGTELWAHDHTTGATWMAANVRTSHRHRKQPGR